LQTDPIQGETGEMMKLSLTSAVCIVGVVTGLIASTTAADAAVTFTTFVPINGTFANLAFNYTGTGFVGESDTFGTNIHRLYSTNLTGGDAQPYGEPIPGGLSGNEGAIGVGLGQAGFGKGVVYVGNEDGNLIYSVPSVGPPVLAGTLPVAESARAILFDPGSTFGGDMLVSTGGGQVYKFTSSGTRTLLANVGDDVEGLAIAGSAFGPYAGDLLATGEDSGAIWAISPGGIVTRLRTGASTFVKLQGAETVSFVPPSLSSTNSLEGFYVDNVINILKAPASEFLSLTGTAVVTTEAFGQPMWDLKYDSTTGFFDVTQIGAVPNDPEAAFFVTGPLGVSSVPEPSTWAMLLLGFTGLGFVAYRQTRRAMPQAASLTA
jgi:PEP-CTERM motif